MSHTVVLFAASRLACIKEESGVKSLLLYLPHVCVHIVTTRMHAARLYITSYDLVSVSLPFHAFPSVHTRPCGGDADGWYGTSDEGCVLPQCNTQASIWE